MPRLNVLRKMGRPTERKTFQCDLLDALMSEIDTSALAHRHIEQKAGVPAGAIANLRFYDPENPKYTTMQKLAAFMGFRIELVPTSRTKKTPTPKHLDALDRGRAKGLITRRGVDVPPELEDDWKVLKAKRFTNAEAAKSLGLTYLGDRK